MNRRSVFAVIAAAFASFIGLFTSRFASATPALSAPTHMREVVAGMTQMILEQGEHIAALSAKNRELSVALRDQLLESMQELALHHRAIEERKRIFKVLPRIVNETTCRQVFSEDAVVEDTALVDVLCAYTDEGEMRELTALLGVKSPELAALFAERWKREPR
jgi:hypothetical protein